MPSPAPAEVISNTGTVLYAGQTRELIEQDGFQIRLPLAPRSPVMQLCIEPGEFSLEIANRGRGILNWQLIPPPEQCGGPCVLFVPETGDVPAGAAFNVVFDLLGNAPGPLNVRATSPVGDIAFQIIPPTPAARLRKSTLPADLQRQ